jgi:hypothetical protein
MILNLGKFLLSDSKNIALDLIRFPLVVAGVFPAADPIAHKTKQEILKTSKPVLKLVA